MVLSMASLGVAAFGKQIKRYTVARPGGRSIWQPDAITKTSFELTAWLVPMEATIESYNDATIYSFAFRTHP